MMTPVFLAVLLIHYPPVQPGYHAGYLPGRDNHRPLQHTDELYYGPRFVVERRASPAAAPPLIGGLVISLLRPVSTGQGQKIPASRVPHKKRFWRIHPVFAKRRDKDMGIHFRRCIWKAVFSLLLLLSIGNGISAAAGSVSFIQPFFALFEEHDLHVMLFFEGHKEYEAAEAMIRKGNENEPPLIRAILTRHDQTQIDYINSKELVEQLQKRGASRETYYADIQYDWDLQKSKPEVFLRFRTINNELVEFNLYAAAKPTKKYGGLTDPEGHAKDSALPVMYRGKSTLAAKKSSISIDGISYKIPYMVRIPIFFTGMKGYYTEEFLIGVIFAGEKRWELVKAPPVFAEGEKWIYKAGGEEKEYIITGVQSNEIKIAGENEVITAEMVDGEIGIKEIAFLPPFDQERSFSLSFTPALIFRKETGQEIEFSLAIDDGASLVSGALQKEKTADGIVLRLIPKEPGWARERMVKTEIKVGAGEIFVRTTVGSHSSILVP